MRAVLLVMLVAGCDWSLHRMQDQPRCDTDEATTLLDGNMCALQPPPGVVAMTPPAATPTLTRALVERGRDRFERFCAPCHGVAGDADTYVAKAMLMRHPPSLLDKQRKETPDAKLLLVIDRGYGVMPAYGSALGSTDRHAIVQYLRVLQSRETALDALPADQQVEARAWLR